MLPRRSLHGRQSTGGMPRSHSILRQDSKVRITAQNWLSAAYYLCCLCCLVLLGAVASSAFSLAIVWCLA